MNQIELNLYRIQECENVIRACFNILSWRLSRSDAKKYNPRSNIVAHKITESLLDFHIQRIMWKSRKLRTHAPWRHNNAIGMKLG